MEFRSSLESCPNPPFLIGGNRHYFGEKNQAKSSGIWEKRFALSKGICVRAGFH